MAEQISSEGMKVHFVYGTEHVPAIITKVGAVPEGEVIGTTTLTVFPPNEQPFTTNALHDQFGNPATWHWLEYEPAKD